MTSEKLSFDDSLREIEYGGFWIKTAAYILDLMFASVPWIFIGIFLSKEALDTNLANILLLIYWWLYNAIMESSSWQATFGKKVVNLYVVDQNMKRISFARATGRFFSHFFSLISCGIGYLMSAWTYKKQAMHDMICGTYIVEKYSMRDRL
jgi:uncharacterized RDD family membrane protein YckC